MATWAQLHFRWLGLLLAHPRQPTALCACAAWTNDSKGSDPAFVPADDDGTGDRRQRLPAPRGPAGSGQELGQAADDKQRPRRVAMPVVGGDGLPGGERRAIPDVELDAGPRAVSRVRGGGSSRGCRTEAT